MLSAVVAAHLRLTLPAALLMLHILLSKRYCTALACCCQSLRVDSPPLPPTDNAPIVAACLCYCHPACTRLPITASAHATRESPFHVTSSGVTCSDLTKILNQIVHLSSFWLMSIEPFSTQVQRVTAHTRPNTAPINTVSAAVHKCYQSAAPVHVNMFRPSPSQLYFQFLVQLEKPHKGGELETKARPKQ